MRPIIKRFTAFTAALSVLLGMNAANPICPLTYLQLWCIIYIVIGVCAFGYILEGVREICLPFLLQFNNYVE
ncbi:MAG: hypothetical protein ACI4JE_08775 [Ruminococcus sp.]